MPGSVRKAVQDDIAVGSTMNDFGVSVRKLGEFAEDAAISRLRFSRLDDVGVTPGRPEVVHASAG